MVGTEASGRRTPDLAAMTEGIVPAEDGRYRVGGPDKRFSAIYAIIAVLSSMVLGGVYMGSTIEGYLFVNASTVINESLYVNKDTHVGNYTFQQGAVINGSEGVWYHPAKVISRIWGVWGSPFSGMFFNHDTFEFFMGIQFGDEGHNSSLKFMRIQPFQIIVGEVGRWVMDINVSRDAFIYGDAFLKGSLDVVNVTTTMINVTDIFTDTLEVRINGSGATFVNFTGPKAKFFDHSGRWFSMSGSGTLDDGTNFYIPYRDDGSHFYFGWGATYNDVRFGPTGDEFYITAAGAMRAYVNITVLASGSSIRGPRIWGDPLLVESHINMTPGSRFISPVTFNEPVTLLDVLHINEGFSNISRKAGPPNRNDVYIKTVRDMYLIASTGSVKVPGDLEAETITMIANTTAQACTEGEIYYDGGSKKHYGCNGTWNSLY